jgi:hypothetical protein
MTDKPKKKRGRKPPAYGPRLCPWCAEKLRRDDMANQLFCFCGYRQK